VPLAAVAARLTIDGLTASIRSLHHTLIHDFGISAPRIAVLGLNPHAGENGHIGTEERTIIAPAIERSRNGGCHADGPFAADGFFAFGDYQHYDGILAMYHDQGLVPLKLLARGGGVNVTCGLPVVRTSPDHGTAFGIAGKGIADPTSTVEALLLAASIAERRKR
jgi:4-hydroxythreonine-4-phosphate dehydrogenase